MHENNIFTINETSFAGLKEFVEDLHSQNRKYGLIVDPGLPSHYKNESEYPEFFEALNSS